MNTKSIKINDSDIQNAIDIAAIYLGCIKTTPSDCYAGRCTKCMHSYSKETICAAFDTIVNVLRDRRSDEGLRQKGKLVEIPCAVGDTMYAIKGEDICEYKIFSIEIYDTCIAFNCIEVNDDGKYVGMGTFYESDIGNSVFYSKKAARFICLDRKIKQKER